MHITTRQALEHNQALTQVLGKFRQRLLQLRKENHRLNHAFDEMKQSDRVNKQVIKKLTLQAVKKTNLLDKVSESAEKYFDHFQEYKKVSQENERLKKTLTTQQGHLDAMSQLINQLQERATERDIALELTLTQLRDKEKHVQSLMSE